MRSITFSGGFASLVMGTGSAAPPYFVQTLPVSQDQFTRTSLKQQTFKAPHFGMQAAPPPPPPPGQHQLPQVPEDAQGDNNQGEQDEDGYRTPNNAPIPNNGPPPLLRHGLVPNAHLAPINLLGLFNQVAAPPTPLQPSDNPARTTPRRKE